MLHAGKMSKNFDMRQIVMARQWIRLRVSLKQKGLWVAPVQQW